MEMGVPIVHERDQAEALVIGTLSPGPMLDAAEALASDRRVVVPWSLAGASGSTSNAFRTAA
jgi:hypothetical protein